MKNNNSQRIGSKSNAHVGKEFERTSKKYFLKKENIELKENFSIDIGILNIKKEHRFDLGISDSVTKILVECKSHKWTEGKNVPSAKLTNCSISNFCSTLSASNFVLLVTGLGGIKKLQQSSWGKIAVSKVPIFLASSTISCLSIPTKGRKIGKFTTSLIVARLVKVWEAT